MGRATFWLHALPARPGSANRSKQADRRQPPRAGPSRLQEMGERPQTRGLATTARDPGRTGLQPRPPARAGLHDPVRRCVGPALDADPEVERPWLGRGRRASSVDTIPNSEKLSMVSPEHMVSPELEQLSMVSPELEQLSMVS